MRTPFDWLVVSFLCTAFIHGTSYASAMIIFNNFGSGDSFVHNAGQTIGDLGSLGLKTAAMPFTPGGNDTLDRIEIAASVAGGPTELDVWVTNTENDLSGVTLESFHFSEPLGISDTILSADSMLHPLLQAGSMYWLLATDTPSAQSTWYNSSETGSSVYRFDSGPWRMVEDGSLGAFRITGSPVPEPSSAVLFAIGTAFIAIRRLR